MQSNEKREKKVNFWRRKVYPKSEESEERELRRIAVLEAFRESEQYQEKAEMVNDLPEEERGTVKFIEATLGMAKS